MKGPVFIMDHFGLIVSRVSEKLLAELGTPIRYMWGHPIEIVNRLQAITKNPEQAKTKFPLVALFTDIPITKSKQGLYGDAKLQIIIANLTRQEYYSTDRLEYNFKPILQPIKVELLAQMQVYKQFTYPGEITYTEIERYFWGKEGLYGNVKNVFNDYIDCIELRDVAVTVKELIC